MTEQREPFDDFLKRKYDNKDFGFKEEYWLEAEKLLEKKKRRKGFFWIFLFLGLASGITAWVLMRDSNNQTKAEIIAPQNNYPTITKPGTKNEITKQNNISTTDEIKENNIPIISQNNTRKSNFIVAYKKYQDYTKTIETQLKQSETAKSKTDEIIENNTGKVVVNEVPKIAETTQKDAEIKEPSDSVMETKTIDSNDIQEKKYIDFFNKNKRWIGLYAGVTYDAGITKKPTPSVSFGINIEKTLTSKWMAGMGILYYNSGSITISKVYNTQSYNYGITNYTNTVTTNRLDYASLPFYLKGRLYKDHWLKGGIGLSFLLSTKNNIVMEEQQDFETPTVIKYSEPNHKTGLTLFDPQLFAAYQYQFRKRWSVEAKYFFGLLPVASKTHFGVQQENIYNRGFNLYIHYNFLNY